MFAQLHTHLKRLSCFLLFFLLFSTGLIAQHHHFEHYLGNRPDQSAVYFKSVPDGYVIVGSSIDSVYHTRGYYILKTDLDGKKVWDRNYSDAFSSYAAGMTVLSNGNIAIVGTHASIFYSALAEVLLLDSAGNFINSVNYPPFDGWGTSGVGIESADDSSIVITIYTDGFISTNYYSIYRLNSDLSTRWTEFISYDGSLLNSHSLTKTPDQGYYSLAYYDFYYYSPSLIYKASYIRSFDSTGAVHLDSLFLFDLATNAITSMKNGDAMIAGTQDSSGQKNITLLQIDTTGNLLMNREYGSLFDEEPVAIVQTYDDGFAILGQTPDPTLPGQHDLFLMRTNAQGDSLWTKRFGSVLNETALHLEQVEDSGFVILGTTSAYPDRHIYFVKTDSLGVVESPYSINYTGKYFCSGDSTELDIVPFPPAFSYAVWNTGDTGVSIKVDTGGVYFATIYDTSGNAIESQSFSAYFAIRPTVELGPDTLGLCDGGAIINGISSDLTFFSQWSCNDSIIGGAHGMQLVPADTGHYTLTISNYCGTDSDMVFIDTLYLHPALPVITSPEVPYVCEFDSLHLSVQLDNGLSAQWYEADDFNSYIIPGAVDSFYYATQEGLYFVTVTDSFGCSASSDPRVVAYDQIPSNVNSTGPSAFCDGGEVELYVPAGSNYLWSTGDTSQTIAVNSAGDYFVSFTDVNGCPKVSDTLTITILANPVISIGPDTTVCNNIIYTFEAPPGFNNYLWNDGSNDIIYDAFVNGNIADTQSVFVFVTDTNGCSTSDTAQIIFDVCDGIANPAAVSLLEVYPNPSQSGQAVYVNLPAGSDAFALYNSLSSLICIQENVQKRSIRLPDLAPGEYLLRSGNVYKRIVVLK